MVDGGREKESERSFHFWPDPDIPPRPPAHSHLAVEYRISTIHLASQVTSQAHSQTRILEPRRQTIYHRPSGIDDLPTCAQRESTPLRPSSQSRTARTRSLGSPRGRPFAVYGLRVRVRVLVRMRMRMRMIVIWRPTFSASQLLRFVGAFYGHSFFANRKTYLQTHTYNTRSSVLSRFLLNERTAPPGQSGQPTNQPTSQSVSQVGLQTPRSLASLE